MRIARPLAVLSTLAALGAGAPAPAFAGGHADAIIAGAAGVTVGALLGNALARPRVYAPGPVYIAPPPPPPVVVYQPVPVYQPAPVYYGPPPAWSPAWYSYCAGTYASFDAQSGTIVDPDGYRRLCR